MDAPTSPPTEEAQLTPQVAAQAAAESVLANLRNVLAKTKAQRELEEAGSLATARLDNLQAELEDQEEQGVEAGEDLDTSLLRLEEKAYGLDGSSAQRIRDVCACVRKAHGDMREESFDGSGGFAESVRPAEESLLGIIHGSVADPKSAIEEALRRQTITDVKDRLSAIKEHLAASAATLQEMLSDLQKTAAPLGAASAFFPSLDAVSHAATAATEHVETSIEAARQTLDSGVSGQTAVGPGNDGDVVMGS